MTTYIFNSTPKTNKYSDNNTFYFPKSKYTDYSKILDDLIFDDLIEKNPWLNYSSKKAGDDILMSAIIKPEKKYDDLFWKASDFLANYNKKYKTYFIKDKTYTLSDGTNFEITDDYIHIGDKLYMFSDFADHNYLLKLTEPEKKAICIIYTAGLKITIKK